MSGVTFGRLTDMLPREAWSHEAHAFTPWLAENIDQLAEAIGVPLELTGTEMAVESFSADILARNPQDGTVVLIENQLEQTDHTHLGQIMTYLAGLEAQKVIWIAPRFREPHLSAIRWLNEHTADGFGFFAVKLRVVRIGDSPYAPVFEVVEQPNDWDRQLSQTRRNSAGNSELGDLREAFWNFAADRDPSGGLQRTRKSYSVQEAVPGILVVSWVGQRSCGTFVRGPYGDAESGREKLEPFSEALEQALSAEFGGPEKFLGTEHPGSVADRETWSAAADTLIASRNRYISVLKQVLEGQ